MKLRKLIRVLHRDVGYFLVPLVLIYSISGIAVNHIDGWNPNYSRSRTKVTVGVLEPGTLDALESQVVEKLDIDQDDVRGRHRPSANKFEVFLPDGGGAEIDLRTGEGTLTRVTRRAALFEMNVLHLNHLKGVWTYVADAMALLLAGLAITGLFILKGKNGLGGRGKWFLAAGTVVPIAFVVVYYSSR